MEAHVLDNCHDTFAIVSRNYSQRDLLVICESQQESRTS